MHIYSTAQPSSNVVYAVFCTKCKHVVYVGETETQLKERIQNHLSDIRTHKQYDKPVSIHFHSKGHSIKHFKFVGIEIPRKNHASYRRTRESLFIKMCNTQREGINIRSWAQKTGLGADPILWSSRSRRSRSAQQLFS